MEPEEGVAYRPPKPKRPTRRDFIRLALGLGGAAVVGSLAYRFLLSVDSSSPGEPLTPGENDYLESFNSNIVTGGPPKDGIPSIDRPKFISRQEADSFLRPEDIVFGIAFGGVVRAYPQRILVWHEIVNDMLGGEPISITYCPLTGSQVAFRRRLPGGSVTTFGTSGNLVNSNLLMYDRLTDSNWPQILGTAINGPRRGQTLEEVPLVWTTWSRWREVRPETEVLSIETGFLRNYSWDPYGSYVPELAGYYANDGLLFPVMNRSGLFPPKKVVVGIKVADDRLAVPLAEFRSILVRNVNLGRVPMVLLYDPDLDVIRAFRRTAEDTRLTFEVRDGKYVDRETGTVWSAEGRGLEGPLGDVSLQQVNAYNVMWFAWYAFYPDTTVLQ